MSSRETEHLRVLIGEHSRRTNRKLVDLASAVVDGHRYSRRLNQLDYVAERPLDR